MSGEMASKGKKRDILIALLLGLVVLLVAGSTLSYDCGWGDDFAAYMSEGIAIAQGKLEEQTEVNAFMHPLQLPDGTLAERRVYVWGYPLMLALVYKLVGFDTVNFQSLIYYKLPILLCLAVTAAVLFLFYRKRMGALLSAFLSLMLCLNREVVNVLYTMYSDVVFLAFSVLSVYLAECYFEALGIDQTGRKKGKPLLWGLLLGAALWYTYETRLSGNTIAYTVLALHLLLLLKSRRKSGQGLRWRDLAQFLPYLLMLLLRLIFESFIFLPASSNTSDIGFNWPNICANARYYLKNIKYFFACMPGLHLNNMGNNLLFGSVLLLAILGLIFSRRCRTADIVYLVFVAGSFIVLLLLPYTQGTRYFFNTIPFILTMVGYGLEFLWACVLKRIKGKQRLLKAVAGTLVMTFMAYACAASLSGNLLRVLRGEDVRQRVPTSAYSEAALEMYRYVQQELEEDAVIAFMKARALYLNTGRLTVSTELTDDISQADYWIRACNYGQEYLYELHRDRLELIHWDENDAFMLYRVIKD